VDRALFRYALLEAARLPDDSRIAPIDEAAGVTAGMSEDDAGKAIDAFLDKLYAGTKLFDLALRQSLLEKPTADVLATQDTFVDLAVKLYPATEEVEERGKKNEGLRSRLTPTYTRGLLEFAGGVLPPDANGTLRVTFGKVEGVEQHDGLMYLPQTSIAGIVEKHTGKGDFNAPQRELDAIAAFRAGKKTPYVSEKLGSVPVNFLATVDTTGGNSGSPALSAKGELVGLLFDGTFDTVGSDIVFDPVRTRSILVDVRYMYWVMTEVDAATHILQEMGSR